MNIQDEGNEGLLSLFDLLIHRVTNLKKFKLKKMEPSWDFVSQKLMSLSPSLHIQFDPHEGEVFHSALRKILTHLTQLVHLDLEVTSLMTTKSSLPDSNWRCWDILTGGARHPRPVHDFALADWNLVPGASLPDEPLNGIYSSCNMKGKLIT